MITFPICMLGWIFFRAQNLPDAIVMYAKVIDPREYLCLGLRENYYLIAALVMMSVITWYYFKTFMIPMIRRQMLLATIMETTAFAVIIGLVFVFLRPINQFIYFQF